MLSKDESCLKKLNLLYVPFFLRSNVLVKDGAAQVVTGVIFGFPILVVSVVIDFIILRVP